MRIGIAPAWALGLTLVFATGVAAQPPTPVSVVRLANGLNVLFAPDTSATTVDVAVWYPAGTRWEPAGKSGLTHLLEGLMFSGSRRFGTGDHGRLVSAAGGLANTFTTPDYSCFYETLPPSGLDLALQLEADRMASLTLDQRRIDAAKRQAMAARRASAGENSPIGRGLRELYGQAWAGHPYRWPASGGGDDLSRLTLLDVTTYWKSHYGPDQTLLTVVGRFDPAVAEAAVRRAFEGVARRGAPVKPAASVGGGPRRVTRATDAQVPLVLVGWRTPPDSSIDAVALDVLSRALGSGPTARLRRDLVDSRHVCLLTQCQLDSRHDGGLFYAMAAVNPEADTSEAETAVLDEVEKLAGEAIGDDELESAKRGAETEMLMSWQTARGLAQSLGAAQLDDGGWSAMSSRLDRLRRLSGADVSRAAARTFVPAKRSVVWLMPGAAQAAPRQPAKPRPTPARKPATGGKP